MKKMVRYLLEGAGRTPEFITVPGFLKEGHELVGVSVDDEMLHLPKTVKVLTRAEMVARAVRVCKDFDGKPVTKSRAETIVASILEMCGVPDYE